jgi:hypothetical protein
MAERKKMIGSGEREPEFIRADIEKTRRRMTSTIDEIQERFTPEHMKSVAKSVLKEQTVDRAGRMARQAREGVMKARTTMYEFVRENPLPSAMVGLGLSWFLTDILMEGRRFGEGMEGEEHAYREHRRHYPEGAGENAARQTAQHAAQHAGRRAMEGPGLISGRYGMFPLILFGASIAAGAAIARNMPSSETQGEIGETVQSIREKAKVKAEQFKRELKETT